ncbi:hypothetical protein HNI00_16180 [Thermoleptolyngbya oregonensis NK1-22]|jgi:hypothetical protein|uniref:Uncharacterized protein n=1 Tax=Thermoleptolyngbya oregonensis NK1-22 TaxID=2547457 RepID=A0AA96YBA6_9CYAN|nr:hypothetical protein [Thermoleptolyngbya oregonensis]WOB44513.1 hypothetical protein HNI00_16180 [Thermoleptolyngbya oregonensis NK1-22]
MTTTGENQSLLDRIAALKETLVDQLGPQLIQNPQLADALTQRIEDMLAQAIAANAAAPVPADGGLADLIGIGKDAAKGIDETRLPQGVEDYDEQVASDRILSVADLYYLYQMETVGVFRAIRKLQELFDAGAVRLSTGEGAYGLYRFDRRSILRYAERNRMQTYRRVFGYTTTPPMPSAKPNAQFHGMFTQFINSVAAFWRDKRISDVIRERAYDPSFGSIATVRRAGLDLRNNLKWNSYGHVNVFRIETLQLLDEAFRILGAEDVRKLFGAENAWDVVEEVMLRYFNKHVNASQRHRMATSGRSVIRWLAQKYILNSSRAEFEALLREIADVSEEWLTSAEVLGIAFRGHTQRVVPINAGRNGNVAPLRAGQG